MLVKVLGVIDFIGGLILLFSAGVKIPVPVLVVLAVIFLIKAGIGLLKDFASWIDLIAGIIFILMMFFPVYWIVCIIAGILLIQKGIVSFL
jgi:hypothetical protein